MPAFYRPKFGRLPEAPRGLLRSRLLACTLGVFLALGPAWMHWLASFTGHHCRGHLGRGHLGHGHLGHGHLGHGHLGHGHLGHGHLGQGHLGQGHFSPAHELAAAHGHVAETMLAGIVWLTGLNSEENADGQSGSAHLMECGDCFACDHCDEAGSGQATSQETILLDGMARADAVELEIICGQSDGTEQDCSICQHFAKQLQPAVVAAAIADQPAQRESFSLSLCSGAPLPLVYSPRGPPQIG
ncbi:MAG: hypothetical protein ACK6A8_09690 [Planctomycetota bacterium]